MHKTEPEALSYLSREEKKLERFFLELGRAKKNAFDTKRDFLSCPTIGPNTALEQGL